MRRPLVPACASSLAFLIKPADHPQNFLMDEVTGTRQTSSATRRAVIAAQRFTTSTIGRKPCPVVAVVEVAGP